MEGWGHGPDVAEDKPGQREERKQRDGAAEGVADWEQLCGGGAVLAAAEDAEDEKGGAHHQCPERDVRLQPRPVSSWDAQIAQTLAEIPARSTGNRCRISTGSGTGVRERNLCTDSEGRLHIRCKRSR